jgi:hypothetical protein
MDERTILPQVRIPAATVKLSHQSVGFQHPAKGENHCGECEQIWLGQVVQYRAAAGAGCGLVQEIRREREGGILMQYSEVLDHNAAMRKGRGKKPALDHLRVEEAENGGHVVEHHFESSTGAYKEPEKHVFSKPLDGDAKPQLPEGHVLLHVAKHLGIPHEVIGQTHAKPSENPEKTPDEKEKKVCLNQNVSSHRQKKG